VCRDALTRHLRGDAMHELDRRVVSWVFERIQRQVRAGSITPELAQLAAHAADSFGDTPEGASLRSALPNLRRRAGLCPECGGANREGGEACPACLAERDAILTRQRPGGATSKGYT